MIELTTAQLCKLLGISKVYVNKLERGKKLDGKLRPGRWDGEKAVQSYISGIRDSRSSQSKEESLKLTVARREKYEEAAEEQRMRNAQLRGDLLDRDDVDEAVVGAFSRVRARLLNIPSKVAPLVIGVNEPAVAEGHIRKGVNEALEELSSTAIEDLRRNNDELVEGADSTPRVNGKRVGRQRKVPKSGGKRRTRKMEHRAS